MFQSPDFSMFSRQSPELVPPPSKPKAPRLGPLFFPTLVTGREEEGAGARRFFYLPSVSPMEYPHFRPGTDTRVVPNQRRLASAPSSLFFLGFRGEYGRKAETNLNIDEEGAEASMVAKLKLKGIDARRGGRGEYGREAET